VVKIVFHGDLGMAAHRPAKYPQGEGLSGSTRLFEETFGTFPLLFEMILFVVGLSFCGALNWLLSPEDAREREKTTFFEFGKHHGWSEFVGVFYPSRNCVSRFVKPCIRH